MKVSRDEVNSVATRFAENCTNPTSDLAKLRQDAQQLYAWLIRPVEDHLDGKRSIVWIPDNSFARVPVAALVDSDGSFLAAKYTTLLSPWPSALTRKYVSHQITNRDPILLLAPSKTEPKLMLPFLADAEVEVESIRGLFKNSVVLSGQDATLSALRRNINGKTILHYAGHSEERASGTRLILAQESEGSVPGTVRLSAGEISDLRLGKYKLVVLSACSTNRGEDHDWVDPGSLVFALLDEGVWRVVATRWRTDSQTASSMMTDFYGHLLHGEAPEVAIRSASEALRRGSGTSHPYFWASFDSFGFQ
jgi:CHAT domain-containing protein